MALTGVTVLRSPTFLTIIVLAMILFGIGLVTLLLVEAGIVKS
ncbi:hypothetical protein [Acidianus bottle-shaped virus 3 strain ABV3]|uniref:Uncharacterized protein n=1 Tax=Acidianus bottle-shaped virus 3 strain ABV3 TaxID=1732174 RepID=A0A0N7FYX8_9VIRU|nr:hypothetical protein AVU00_gp58 [Acidianus bottle-shaped virus 3 strain ABV3]ALG96860.1 hypothetical protein [Acidianus bottle-shaped virus 3 strain ABV3]